MNVNANESGGSRNRGQRRGGTQERRREEWGKGRCWRRRGRGGRKDTLRDRLFGERTLCVESENPYVRSHSKLDQFGESVSLQPEDSSRENSVNNTMLMMCIVSSRGRREREKEAGGEGGGRKEGRKREKGKEGGKEEGGKGRELGRNERNLHEGEACGEHDGCLDVSSEMGEQILPHKIAQRSAIPSPHDHLFEHLK